MTQEEIARNETLPESEKEEGDETTESECFVWDNY